MARTRQELEKLAWNRLDGYQNTMNFRSLNPVAVALAEGIDCRNVVFKNVSIAVMFSRQQDEGDVIHIKDDEEVRMKIYFIFVALAHYFLHMRGVPKGGYMWHLSVDTSSLEPEIAGKIMEAHYYAMAIIMPERLVKKAWNMDCSIREMADVFHVTEKIMHRRLFDLGLAPSSAFQTHVVPY